MCVIYLDWASLNFTPRPSSCVHAEKCEIVQKTYLSSDFHLLRVLLDTRISDLRVCCFISVFIYFLHLFHCTVMCRAAFLNGYMCVCVCAGVWFWVAMLGGGGKRVLGWGCGYKA